MNISMFNFPLARFQNAPSYANSILYQETMVKGNLQWKETLFFLKTFKIFKPMWPHDHIAKAHVKAFEEASAVRGPEDQAVSTQRKISSVHM